MKQPAGRRVAGGLASALAVALLVTAAWSSPSPPAAAAPSRSDVAGQAPPAPGLTVAAQSAVVANQDSFLLAVRVVGAPPGGRLRVSVLPAVDDRAEFDDTLDLATKRPRGELFNLDLIPAADLPTNPDGSQQLSLAFGGRGQPGAALVRRPGVYPVQVRLLAADDTILAGLTTHLVRSPSSGDPAERLRVAVLLPLHARPAVQPDGSTRISAKDLRGLRTVLDTLSAHPFLAATVTPTPETMDALASSSRQLESALLSRSPSPDRQPAPPGPDVDVRASRHQRVGRRGAHRRAPPTARPRQERAGQRARPDRQPNDGRRLRPHPRGAEPPSPRRTDAAGGARSGAHAARLVGFHRAPDPTVHGVHRRRTGTGRVDRRRAPAGLHRGPTRCSLLTSSWPSSRWCRPPRRDRPAVSS